MCGIGQVVPTTFYWARRAETDTGVIMFLSSLTALVTLVAYTLPIVRASPTTPTPTVKRADHDGNSHSKAVAAGSPPNCFPALGFTMPSAVPSSTTNWWCDYSTEYAFMGFSYEVSECECYLPVETLVSSLILPQTRPESVQTPQRIPRHQREVQRQIRPIVWSL